MINISVTLSGDKGNVQILKDINLTLENNKIYALAGPNGGGKSSIAKTIMGIYKPTEGKILLDGMDITHMDISERARLGIGYSFQEPPRFKGIKVRELLNWAAGSDKLVDMVDLLYDVGLCAPYYVNRENTNLSGGELKRIEIASILARTRKLKVAIFDEPDSGVDLWSFQKLKETFEKMHEQNDIIIVIISHHQHIIKMADRVILVANGRHKTGKNIR